MSKESQKKDFWYKLETIDSKVLYIMLLVPMTAVLVMPIGLPMRIAPFTQTAFDELQALPTGSIVLFGNEISARDFPEEGPIAIALLNHLFHKHVKLVIVTIEEGEGPMNFELRMKDRINMEGARYGEDWVHLGFVTGGGEIAGSAIATDIHAVFRRDYRGNAIDSLPLMEKVHSIKDINYVVVAAGSPLRSYLRQINSAYGTPMVAGTGAMMFGEFRSFLNPKQLRGLVVSLPGAAQYEKLMVAQGWGKYGMGTRAMDSMSMGYLVIIVAVVIGNIAYFGRKIKGGK